MTKAFVAPTVHFKGSGWAKKDRSTARASRTKDEGSSAASAGETKTSGDGSGSDSGASGAEPKKTEAGDIGRLQGKPALAFRLVVQLVRLTRPMAGSASDWITLAEASEILAAANIGFRPATIGSWARAGKLQSIKLGGRRFVRRGEVRALVAAPRRVRAEELQPALFEDLRR